MPTTKEYDLLTPISDFPNGAFNFDNFIQEITSDPAVLIKPELDDLPALASLPRRVRARWPFAYPGDPTETAYLARIAVHQGGTSNDAPVRIFSETDVDAPNSTPVPVLSLVRANVARGTYQISVNVMHRMLAEITNAESTIGLLVNGQLRQFDQWRFVGLHSWGLSFPVDRLAGQSLNVTLQISRMGGASGTARALGIVPTTGNVPACSIAIDRTG